MIKTIRNFIRFIDEFFFGDTFIDTFFDDFDYRLKEGDFSPIPEDFRKVNEDFRRSWENLKPRSVK